MVRKSVCNYLLVDADKKQQTNINFSDIAKSSKGGIFDLPFSEHLIAAGHAIPLPSVPPANQVIADFHPIQPY